MRYHQYLIFILRFLTQVCIKFSPLFQIKDHSGVEFNYESSFPVYMTGCYPLGTIYKTKHQTNTFIYRYSCGL